MLKKPVSTVFGALFGIFSLLFSFVVLFVLFDPLDAISVLGPFISLAACLLNPAANIIISLNHGAYIIGLGGFVLSIVAICASGMRRHYITSGVLLLISTIGVFVLYYYPLLFGFNGGLIGSLLSGGFDFGASTEAAVLMVIALAALLFTILGFIGAIVSFYPRKAVYGQPYPPQDGQPQQAPVEQASQTSENEPPKAE